jgi:hypothetical protein
MDLFNGWRLVAHPAEPFSAVVPFSVGASGNDYRQKWSPMDSKRSGIINPFAHRHCQAEAANNQLRARTPNCCRYFRGLIPFILEKKRLK